MLDILLLTYGAGPYCRMSTDKQQRCACLGAVHQVGSTYMVLDCAMLLPLPTGTSIEYFADDAQH